MRRRTLEVANDHHPQSVVTRNYFARVSGVRYAGSGRVRGRKRIHPVPPPTDRYGMPYIEHVRALGLKRQIKRLQVKLLNIQRVQRRKPATGFIAMRSSAQWDANYRYRLTHYGKVCERLKAEQYRKWAVFTIVDCEPLRMAA